MMSLVKTALRQIKKYGFKGAAKLTSVSSVSSLNNLEVTQTPAVSIDLNSYVGKYPSNKVDGTTIFVNDRRVLATPDDDWDGSITQEDEITIDGSKYSIVTFSIKRIKNVIAYVEIQCRG